MSYKIVFFDIDGTLLNKENRIPADTKEAVRCLKEQGIQVAIATGRSPYHLAPIASELEIDTYVSFNGSYVVCKGEVVYANCLRQESLSRLEKTAKEHGHPLVYLSESECYANSEQHPLVIESFHYLSLDPPDCQADFWQGRSIYQAFLYCQEHEESKYVGMFPDVSFIRWYPYALDVLPAQGSKAKGIEALLDHLGLSAADAVAFGDGLNDREMLNFVGMGIAMGNAHEEVKSFADMTTRHVNNGGISYGLQKIGLIR
ncbi:Cof-type HAD-IIB family hydrolase [Brevibacillus massiliensis]|uniref:Cof-type HAD-IIB family hydrolase n=1 Tax=Brevibacillus massiliensis TaxID=1118054 RepID=UPI000308FEAD|nr:Cof-type HAD-IIB family hydrolase [Brevibacillus massiliensis]